MAAAEAYLRLYQPGPLPRIFQTTILYDRHGTRLAEIIDEGYRTWVPLSRISPHVREAIIATEDASFYTNPGFDARRVVGAMMQNAEAGEVVSGASTITMQLARQIFFTPAQRFEQSMDRKAFEALLAQDLTTLFTKDEILEMYLNLVHFGQQVYGIEAAANLYFSKSAADLTLAEASLLAGIPQKPAELDPLTNFELVKSRQRIVLDLMARHGYLTLEQADATFAEPIALNSNAAKPPVLAPHFVQYVTAQVGQQLPDVDVRRAGMRIFTTLDLKMQTLAQQLVAEQVTQLRPQFNLSNAALVALKPGTAEILTMVGSADFDNPEIDGQVNVAVRLRQPGSAIKPILYSLAADAELISPATLIWDVPVSYKLDKTEEYTPRNYDDEFHGPVTVRTALANSYNVPAVKLLDALTVERMLAGARAMGITSLTRDTNWYGLSLTLGGGEVTLLDLTTAFHTIANAGRYQPPQAILYTTGAPAGQDLNMGDTSGTQVISPDSAYVITHIMSDNTAREPEFGANSALNLSRPAAAKTGTTTDYRDNWTEGFTRYLVAGVWAGNSDGTPMRNVTGVTGAAPIWHAFMEAVLADPELLATLGAPQTADGWAFIRPSGVISTTVACPQGIRCPESEVFTRSWLERMGEQGPLGDSMIVANMRSVTVDRGNGPRAIGTCSADEGETHQLVRMPFGLTRALPVVSVVSDPRLLQIGATNPLPPFPGRMRMVALEEVDTLGLALDTNLDSEQLKRIHQEQTEALRWGGRNNTTLYLGPCDQAERVARFMYGDSVRAVAVAGYEGVVEDAEPDAEALALAATAVPSGGGGSSSYNVFGVAHDANCGTTLVLGQVMDANGQPVSGVGAQYEDDLGNLSQTTVVNGSFSFPVLAPDQPHTIYISLQGNNGSASVPHLQGGPTSQGCHYVYWRGVD
jgi:penicillin-binding protein 1C